MYCIVEEWPNKGTAAFCPVIRYIGTFLVGIVSAWLLPFL